MTRREPLGRVDAAWLHMDRPENTADIVALMELAGTLPPARLLRLLQARLLARHPRFRQRVVEPFPGRPAWERDPHFALAHHVSHHAVPPGDPAALQGLLDRLATEDLPAGRPPWRAALIASGGRALVAVKLHHCIADGFALVSVLLGLSDEHAAHGAPPPGGAGPRGGLRAALDRAWPLGAALLRSPLASARSLWDMATLAEAAGPLAPRPLSGVRRLAWSSGWPLRELREAARDAGVTVNDLLLAALAGALRARLRAAHPLVEPADVRALLPVNLRPRLAGGAPEALGNRFGLVFADLPAGVADRGARLAQAHARLAAVRRRPDAVVALAVLAALGLAPGPVERLGTAFFSRKASLVVTNLPGPPRRLHVAGRRLERMHFWVPHPSTLGLGVSVLSYAGEVTVGVRADAAVARDPAALVEALEAELARLAPRAALRAERRRGAAPAARGRPGPRVAGRPGPEAAAGEARSPAS